MPRLPEARWQRVEQFVASKRAYFVFAIQVALTVFLALDAPLSSVDTIAKPLEGAIQALVGCWYLHGRVREST